MENNSKTNTFLNNPDVSGTLAKMTLEQKAALCSGLDGWSTVPFEELGIPSAVVSDGPHGLRLMKVNSDDEQLFLHSSVSSTCFPTAVTMASSWDEQFIRSVGEAIAEECLENNVQILLGPGANIKRTPLCGRNFEYYSEDPMLSSRCAASFIEGVQSKGVGTSLKHFLANNQETNRLCVDVNIAERALREIYLASFETAVKRAKPKTIMCSYPRLNGEHCSQNRRFLTDILRGEWGYEGVVMSDWGAVNERVEAIKAGLDLEMPSSGMIGPGKIIKAVRDGSLSEDVLDLSCGRMLRLVRELCLAAAEGHAGDGNKYDRDAHDALAAEMLRRSAVLLKNDNDLLPLKAEGSIAVIGDMADVPRIQGAGSSQVTPSRVYGILESIRNAAPGADISYSQGYVRDSDTPDDALLSQAIEAARTADKAVIVAGLTETFEAEGYDRTRMSIPENQIALIKAVTSVQPDTVLILINGSPVELDFIDSVPAVLEIYLGGQAVGLGTADLLFGKVSPSGRLAETFPLCLENCPADIGYSSVTYDEGVFVGYRYYDTHKYPVRFPFGYGLSYTSFAYDKLSLSADSIKDTDTLTVSVSVKNTGAMRGGEVIQLYVSKPESGVKRPVRELRAFDKVYLEPGKTQTVSFTLDKRAFAYWDEDISDWRAESGRYLIQICSDSRTVLLEAGINVEDTLPSAEKPLVVDRNTTIYDLRTNKETAPLIRRAVELTTEKGGFGSRLAEENSLDMFTQMPLRSVFAMWFRHNNEDMLNELIRVLNDPAERKALLLDENKERLVSFVSRIFKPEN